jgi:hypothetical protein
MKKKRWIYIALLALLAYPASQLFIKTADKFILSEIQSDRPNDPLFDARPLTAEESKEVDVALSQKYTYFGCGGQAYVFFSADGNYVLKFFKQRHFRDPTHLNYIPFIKAYRDMKYAKRYKKICQEYSSYKIGFEEFPYETALIYLHLNKTSHLNKNLTIVDKFNIERQIDLDKTDFIIQRKAELVHDKINKQIAQGDIEGAKQTISNIVNLIVNRCKRGYCDKDPNVETNCGILGDHAIKIDVGRFFPDPKMKKPLFLKPELYHITRPFRYWLLKNQPDLVSHLDNEVFQVILHE